MSNENHTRGITHWKQRAEKAEAKVRELEEEDRKGHEIFRRVSNEKAQLIDKVRELKDENARMKELLEFEDQRNMKGNKWPQRIAKIEYYRSCEEDT